MSGPTVVLDACVLIPIRLTTSLLWLAEAGLFQPLWSDRILDEVERNLPKCGVPPAQAARRVGMMRDAFNADALVEGFDELINEMTCDWKDRHVLAVAVHDHADALVTFNLKDFPAHATNPYEIEVLHPDPFLCEMLAERPAEVTTVFATRVMDLRRPPETVLGWLAGLTATVPTFANLAADASRGAPISLSPIPALLAAGESAIPPPLDEPDDLVDPARVTLAWWAGVLRNLDLARDLTYDPAAWNYQWVVSHLAKRSLASKVIRAVDAPDRIAFMRFVPEAAQSSRVFQPYTTAMTFVTLVKLDDGTWRVWGLGPALLSAQEILGG